MGIHFIDKLVSKICEPIEIKSGVNPFYVLSFGSGLGLAVIDILKLNERSIYFIDLSSELTKQDKITIIDYIFTAYDGILLFWASISNPDDYYEELKNRNFNTRANLYLKGLNSNADKWKEFGFNVIKDLNEIQTIR